MLFYSFDVFYLLLSVYVLNQYKGGNVAYVLSKIKAVIYPDVFACWLWGPPETTTGLDRLSCSQQPSSGRQIAHSEQAGDAALASSAWLT